MIRFFCLILVYLTLIACGGSGSGSGSGVTAAERDMDSNTEINLEPRRESFHFEHDTVGHYIYTGVNYGYGDDVTCEILEDVSHGKIVEQETPCQYVYSPASGFIGDDQFTVVATIVTAAELTEEFHSIEETEEPTPTETTMETITIVLKTRLSDVNIEDIIRTGAIDAVSFYTTNSKEGGSQVHYTTAASPIGDFNADGVDDFAIRSKNTLEPPLNVVVIYGQQNYDNSYDLRDMDNTSNSSLGFHFKWKAEYSTKLSSVNYVGDFKDDGDDDFVIGN